MIPQEVRPIVEFTIDSLRVVVHEDRARMGRAAALEVAEVIAQQQATGSMAHVVFAAAPSQDEFLASLVAFEGDRLVEGCRVPHGRVSRPGSRSPCLVPPLSPGAIVPLDRSHR